jgi:hypothetical protein
MENSAAVKQANMHMHTGVYGIASVQQQQQQRMDRQRSGVYDDHGGVRAHSDAHKSRRGVHASEGGRVGENYDDHGVHA